MWVVIELLITWLSVAAFLFHSLSAEPITAKGRIAAFAALC